MSDMRRTVTIGTRGSRLALAQTEIVTSSLRAHHPGMDIRIERITTRGDVITDRPLTDVGGRGFFVGEIEQALLSRTIDLAVHSAKDLPGEIPVGLALAAFPERADPRDVLVSRGGNLGALPAGARVGTSSPRRMCQLRAARPDLLVADMRGNVDTRLRKLGAGEYDAIVLAAAGLIRLGLASEITEWLDPVRMLSAVAQGALALEIRADDGEMAEVVAPLNHPETCCAVAAERAFLRRMGAGCTAAVAAHASISDDTIVLDGLIGHPDGRLVRDTLGGFTAEPEWVGTALADHLFAHDGARFMADDVRAAPAVRK